MRIVCIVFAIFHLICLEAAAALEVVITGSTGVLGSALAQQALRLVPAISRIHLGYRDATKLAPLLEKAVVAATTTTLVPLKLCFDVQSLSTLHLDFLTDESSSSIRDSRNSLANEPLLLLNNAAVCLQGASAETLCRSLRINTLAPLLLAEHVLSARAKAHSAASATTIINISSGDGELQMLHPLLQTQLSSLSSMRELHEYISSFLAAAEADAAKHLSSSANLSWLPRSNDDACSDIDKKSNSEIELAYGETPCYSLSKALLNVGTRLLQQEWNERHTSSNNINNNNNNVRIVSVCPGDFVSPMSTQDELARAGILDAQEAAREVLKHMDRYEGGSFYRFGQRIDF